MQAASKRNNKDIDTQNRFIDEVWVKVRIHRVKTLTQWVKRCRSRVEQGIFGVKRAL
jgi:hypothetical protein